METVQIRLKSNTVAQIEKIVDKLNKGNLFNETSRSEVIREIVETHLTDYEKVKDKLTEHEKRLQALEKLKGE